MASTLTQLSSCTTDIFRIVCRLVGEVKVVVDKSRVDGSRVRLAEVEVGDETGVVSLRARDDQIDLLHELSKKHGTVVLRNCTLELYQGKHVRLAVTKWGKMSCYPDQVPSTPPPPSKINRDRNFSLIDLTVVASELVGEQFSYAQQQSSPDSDNQSPSGQRNPQYGVGRHNKGTRRPPTYSKTGVSAPGLLGHPGHYAEQAMQHAIPTYHHMTAMQAYAEVPPYTYGQAPEGLVPSQHQIMYQRQQYQIQQQRQIQQLYQSHAEQQRHNMPHSPMLNPGIGPSTSFESFGGPLAASDAHAASVSPFGMSIRATPPSPGMNPKAATYDPMQK